MARTGIDRGFRRLMTAAACAAVLALSFHPLHAQAGATLQRIRRDDKIRCGVNRQLLGFARQDDSGRWRGFAVDFCRAVAAAVLGDPEKASFVPVTAPNRFPMLLAGSIDLLAHTASWTLGREAGIGLVFPAIYLYDGQTFAFPAENKRIKKFEDLEGMSICVVKGTTHLENMENFFNKRGIKHKAVVVDSRKDMGAAIVAGQCQACTSERLALAAMRAAAPNGEARFSILPGSISKEPIAPVVLRGDDEWITIVRWVLFALIEAEERGVTAVNVRSLQKETADPDLQWFLNACGERAQSLGLKPGWVADVIAAGGNYGEIFERNLGSGSALKVDRGLNRLWKDGGLLYAPSFQ